MPRWRAWAGSWRCRLLLLGRIVGDRALVRLFDRLSVARVPVLEMTGLARHVDVVARLEQRVEVPGLDGAHRFERRRPQAIRILVPERAVLLDLRLDLFRR